MNDTTKAWRIRNPRLTLFAFHLRNDLFRVREDVNSLWEQCRNLGKKHGIEPFQLLPENLLSYKDGKNQPEYEDEQAAKENKFTEDLNLLRNKQLRNFEVTVQPNSLRLKGTVDPVRLHDTYALDMTLRYTQTDVTVETADLSLLNLLPGQLDCSLGKTLLLIAEPQGESEDYLKLADECVSGLLQYKEGRCCARLAESTTLAALSRLIGSPGQLFGSPIFEYEVNPADPKQTAQPCHILVCFNRHPKTKDYLDRIAYRDILQLLCCRTKIIHAHRQAYWCNQQARQIYGELEKYSQGFGNLGTDPAQRLQTLKDLLATMSPKEFEYARYQRDLGTHLTTIHTNTQNYRNWLTGIRQISQKFIPQEDSQNLSKENLGFLENFLERTHTYRKQIQIDLKYLVPGQALFQHLLNTIRGIVEIEQAEAFQKKEEAERQRERLTLQRLQAKDNTDKQFNDQLQTTIYIISAGLGGGALVSSNSGLLTAGSDKGEITVEWWSPTSLQLHPFSIAVAISIISAIVFGGAAWGFRKAIQFYFDKAAKRKLKAFIQLLKTQPHKFSDQNRNDLNNLVSTLPNDFQTLSGAIDRWCEREIPEIHSVLLEVEKNLPKNDFRKDDKNYKARLLNAIHAS
ncbi:hypothetical protein NUACC21_49720 [Scytonema sp. NUACC21]